MPLLTTDEQLRETLRLAELNPDAPFEHASGVTLAREVLRLRAQRDDLQARNTELVEERRAAEAALASPPAPASGPPTDLAGVEEALAETLERFRHCFVGDAAPQMRSLILAAVRSLTSRPDLSAEVERLTKQKDGAYAERDQVVALAARMARLLHWPAWLGRHVGVEWDDDWRNIVFIDLPAGQVSWHIHDSEVPLFDFLPHRDEPWDGHDTAEKYRRCAAPWPAASRGPETGDLREALRDCAVFMASAERQIPMKGTPWHAGLLAMIDTARRLSGARGEEGTDGR